MKLLIASDLHGSFKYCDLLFKKYDEEKADRLLFLGDLLYHGPRNDLPEDYAPKKCIQLLNSYAEKIICVKGNCDSQVDQMVLNFPIMADYAVLELDGKFIYASHGHIYTEENPLPFVRNSVMLCGHTHVPKIARHENFTYLNSGSLSLPKENTPHSYMVYQAGAFVWKNLLTGQDFQKFEL